MTMNVRPSRVSSVSGVCTLSITLTGEDEYNISERSSLDRKSTRLNSSHSQISYAVFCLKKKTIAAIAFCGQSQPTYQLAFRTRWCCTLDASGLRADAP